MRISYNIGTILRCWDARLKGQTASNVYTRSTYPTLNALQTFIASCSDARMMGCGNLRKLITLTLLNNCRDRHCGIDKFFPASTSDHRGGSPAKAQQGRRGMGGARWPGRGDRARR